MITEVIAKAALAMLDIDDAGFDYLDRKLLIGCVRAL